MPRPKGYYLAMLKARKELSSLTKEQRMILSLLRKAARAGQPASVTLHFSGLETKDDPKPESRSEKPVAPPALPPKPEPVEVAPGNYGDPAAGPKPTRPSNGNEVAQWQKDMKEWRAKGGRHIFEVEAK